MQVTGYLRLESTYKHFFVLQDMEVTVERAQSNHDNKLNNIVNNEFKYLSKQKGKLFQVVIM